MKAYNFEITVEKIGTKQVSKVTRKCPQFLVLLEACLTSRRVVIKLRIEAFLRLVMNSLQNRLIRLIGSY